MITPQRAGNIATFKKYRAHGGLIGLAPDPRTGHECGDSRYLAIPFLDACLAMHDTPGQPMPQMRYIDLTARTDAKHIYSVITVNSVGLKSEPSAAKQ